MYLKLFKLPSEKLPSGDFISLLETVEDLLQGQLLPGPFDSYSKRERNKPTANIGLPGKVEIIVPEFCRAVMKKMMVERLHPHTRSQVYLFSVP